MSGGAARRAEPTSGGTPAQETTTGDVTRLLIEWRDGDAAALDRLLPLVYSELRRLAQSYLNHERSGHTWQATDLVHEAYLRLVDRTHPKWRDRVHFFAVAAQLMRRILVDHARSVQAQKRGGEAIKLPLEALGDVAVEKAAEIVALDEALCALEAIDRRKSRILELRFFGGLTIEETAGFLDISTATVITDTRMARAWLHTELQRRAAETSP
ncbi:MAG: sigma-70 family RNA polymerase sigma factor [Acidobacteriota bacterium]